MATTYVRELRHPDTGLPVPFLFIDDNETVDGLPFPRYGDARTAELIVGFTTRKFYYWSEAYRRSRRTGNAAPEVMERRATFLRCRVTRGRRKGQWDLWALWAFRLDVLESLRAEAEAQRKLKQRQEFLTRRGVDEQEVALEASLFSRAWNRGAPADEERPIIYGDLL